MTQQLESLRDYFPAIILTKDKKKLVFISEDSKVELTEHARFGFSEAQCVPTIRVRLFAKGSDGYYEPGHYEDFQIPNISTLAGEIDKFILCVLGKNLKEEI